MHAINGWGFLGMHLYWWMFWVLIIVGFTSLFTPVPRQQAKQRGTALDLLQRRYATGAISTEEYEQRRAVLTRDAAQPA
jgi:putative membrane protein